jgi:hypothetical protein
LANERDNAIEAAVIGRARAFPTHFGARAVGEHAVDRPNPRPHRPEMHGVRTCGICRCHAADRAKCSARRINRQSKSVPSGRSVDVSAYRAGPHANGASGHVDVADVVPPAQVDDHAVADGAARHSTARAPRNQRRVCRSAMANERHQVINVGGHRDGLRNDARNSGRLGIHGARGGIVAKYTAKAVGQPERHGETTW